MRFVIRVLGVLIAAAVFAAGLSAIFFAFRTFHDEDAVLFFNIGVFVTLASIPLIPWFIARPWFYRRRYWESRF